MHVLVLTTVHVPRDARILHRQVRTLLEAGHRVTMAAPWSATGSTPPAGVEVIDMPRAAGRRRLRALVASRRLLARLPADVDLVLLHDPELLAAAAVTRPAAPLVWDVHEDVGSSLADKRWLPRPARWVTRAAVRRAERWAERNVHLLLAEEAYAERFHGRHPVVRNFPWERPLGPVERQRRVVYLGRVSAHRGARELIRLGRLLQPDGVELVVIGAADADVREELQQAQLARVLRWHGFLPNPEALELVGGALAGLSLLHDVANYRHSMPTKVLEYMERGIPVITTPLPLAKALVEENSCGNVVAFGDPDAAAEAVRRLLEDEGERARQARNARASALARYTWDSEAGDFVAQLERWADDGPHSR